MHQLMQKPAPAQRLVEVDQLISRPMCHMHLFTMLGAGAKASGCVREMTCVLEVILIPLRLSGLSHQVMWQADGHTIAQHERKGAAQKR